MGCRRRFLIGAYAGKAVEVDHIIPIALAPELSNNLANLRYLSETENAFTGAKVDQDAVRLVKEMRSAGWAPSSGLQTAISNR